MKRKPANPWLLADPAWFVAVTVTILLLFGGYLRFHGNEDKLFWFDEIYSALWFSGHDLKEEFAALEGRVVRVADMQAVVRLDAESDLRAVIGRIIEDDPQHTPAYFVALNLWARLFGDSIGSLRSLSATMDLLLLPFLFWLCLELGGSARTAWLAVALAAISPFHFVYSQEIRQYTMMMFTVVVASSGLLWALRSPAVWKWALYTLAVTAGLYTHLLFCLVLVAHFIFILALVCVGEARPAKADLRNVYAWATAAGAAIVLFSPWIWILFMHLQTAVSRLSWSASDVSLLHLAGMWAYNYSAVFLDTNHNMKFLDEPGALTYVAFMLRALCLIPAGLAVLVLVRHPARKSSLFLLPLLLVPFVGLALPDLTIGGMRSGGGNRYLAPSFLALQIAVAFWFSSAPDVAGSRRRGPRHVALLFMVLMGLASGLIFLHSDTWWHKTIGHFNATVAGLIDDRKNDKALLMAGSPAALLSISHSLKSEVDALYYRGSDWPHVTDRYDDVFVLSPTTEWLSQLQSTSGIEVELMFERAKLYRVSKE